MRFRSDFSGYGYDVMEELIMAGLIILGMDIQRRLQWHRLSFLFSIMPLPMSC